VDREDNARLKEECEEYMKGVLWIEVSILFSMRDGKE
jgi:hypothetical protein